LQGKATFYNHANLQQLQIEADKLEEMGVLAKPEDVGVQFVSPSFLVKKFQWWISLRNGLQQSGSISSHSSYRQHIVR